MSALAANDILAQTLFSASQRAVLGLLFSRPDEKLYLREIVEITGLGMGHIQRELQRLAGAGILRREERGRSVYFQANADSPLFEELRSIVRKTLGATSMLKDALRPLALTIRVAFIYGSIARGEESAASDLDLMVIGDTTFAEVLAAIRKTEFFLRRSINPSVYPLAEFRDKVRSGNHFLTSVVKREKIFILGDNHELGTLLQKQLDPPARDLPRRNSKFARSRRP